MQPLLPSLEQHFSTENCLKIVGGRMCMNNGYLIDKTESRVTLYVLKTISSRNDAYGFMTIVSQDTTVFFW